MADDINSPPFAVRISREGLILRVVRLEPEVTFIGRMPENHLVLDDAKISRSHARIIFSDGQCVLEDQESENGTLVNGKKIERHTLKMGDRIQLGSHLLEVVPITPDARRAKAEAVVDESESDEWRMDRTISGSVEELAKLRLVQSRMAQKPRAPEFSFSLKVGEKTYQKEIRFESGKKRDLKMGQPNEIHVHIEVGEWILDKKISL